MFRRSARSARSFDLLASDLSDRRSGGGCQTHIDGTPSIGNNAQAGGVSISSPDVTPLAPSVRASLVSSSASSPAGSYGLYGFPGLSPRVVLPCVVAAGASSQALAAVRAVKNIKRWGWQAAFDYAKKRGVASTVFFKLEAFEAGRQS